MNNYYWLRFREIILDSQTDEEIRRQRIKQTKEKTK